MIIIGPVSMVEAPQIEINDIDVIDGEGQGLGLMYVH